MHYVQYTPSQVRQFNPQSCGCSNLRLESFWPGICKLFGVLTVWFGTLELPLAGLVSSLSVGTATLLLKPPLVLPIVSRYETPSRLKFVKRTLVLDADASVGKSISNESLENTIFSAELKNAFFDANSPTD